MSEEKEVTYQAYRDGCGFSRGTIIGTMKPGFGFTIAKSPIEEQWTVDFALLPDDFILKGDHGVIITMSQLRKTLRSYGMRQVGIQNCPIFEVNNNRLYPKTMEECSQIYLQEFFKQHPVSDYHGSWITKIVLDEKSVTDSTGIKIKNEYGVQVCRYRKQFIAAMVRMTYVNLNNWWEATDIEIICQDVTVRHYRVLTNDGKANFHEIEGLSDFSVYVDPKPQATGRQVYGYYGVSKIRVHGKLIGTYYPQDVPDILHPRVLPEISEGHELVGITACNSEEVAPILTEPEEFERFVVDLYDNANRKGINRLELYLIETDKLKFCPDEGSVKITE